MAGNNEERLGPPSDKGQALHAHDGDEGSLEGQRQGPRLAVQGSLCGCADDPGNFVWSASWLGSSTVSHVGKPIAGTPHLEAATWSNDLFMIKVIALLLILVRGRVKHMVHELI